MRKTLEQQKIKDFTDLIVWKEGHKLIISLYKVSRGFPKEDLYSLTNQMRRAAVSINSNIAEGFGRRGYKQKIQFYYLAQGSLIELKNQLYIAKDIGYLKNGEFNTLMNQSDLVHRL